MVSQAARGAAALFALFSGLANATRFSGVVRSEVLRGAQEVVPRAAVGSDNAVC